MATVYKMTWREDEGRWRKRYKGKEYYFPAPEGKVASYPRCYQEWLKKKAEVDQTILDDDPNRNAWQACIDRASVKLLELQEEDTADNREAWSFWFGQLRNYQLMLEWGVAFFGDDEAPVDPKNLPDVIVSTNEDGPPPWDSHEVDTDAANPKTVAGNVKRFLARKQQQAERGERSHGRYDVLRCCLEDFAEAVGSQMLIGNLNGSTLVNYRDKLQKRVDRGECSPHYARDHVQAVKQFVRWAWEQELVGLPRVLESRDFTIAIPEKKIEVFATDEVKALLDEAPDTTKLYLLLMLNCGMQQQDIAQLRHDEVDWKVGRITRKRSKTKAHDNVPEVNYKLWPETFRLLKKHRSKHPTLTLTNRKLTPLKSEEIVNGKVKKTDNIRSAFNRVVRNLEIPNVAKKPMKLLRKTAATKLGEHPEYAKFAQHFLGHAPATVADKHYVRPSEEQFDRAVAWLGEQFVNAVATCEV